MTESELLLYTSHQGCTVLFENRSRAFWSPRCACSSCNNNKIVGNIGELGLLLSWLAVKGIRLKDNGVAFHGGLYVSRQIISFGLYGDNTAQWDGRIDLEPFELNAGLKLVKEPPDSFVYNYRLVCL